MQSIIILSKDKENARKRALSLTAEQKISKFDVFILGSEKAIGISDIRNVARQVFLTPLKGERKATVIECFYGATIEAQNAFLKVLEEPPLSTTIILLAHENFFLPTIISRAKLIELDKGIKLTKEDEKNYSEILENLRIDRVDYSLKLARDLSTDKNDALKFLEKFIVFARGEMIRSKNRGEYKKIIEILQKYYKEIKASNVNLRLGLENLFLEIEI